MLIEFLFDEFPTWEEAGEQAIGDLQEFYKKSKERFDQDPVFKERAQKAVVCLQGGEEKYRKAWTQICEISRREFAQVYQRLNVHLEEKGESFYNPFIPEVMEKLKGLIQESEGARVIFIEGKNIPLIVVKSDGGYNYASTDLTALWYRLNVEKADWIIYVTDVGQQLHFEMVFSDARLAGWLSNEKKYPKTSHVGFGLVLGDDGKRFRTRSTTVVRLADLLDEAKFRSKAAFEERGKTVDWTEEEVEEAAHAVGYGVVKYADLKNNRLTNYTFNFDQMLSDKVSIARRMSFVENRSEILFEVLDASLSSSSSPDCSVKMATILSQVALTCMAKLRDERFLSPRGIESDNITCLDVILVKQLSNSACHSILFKLIISILRQETSELLRRRQYALLLSYFQYCQHVLDPDVPALVVQYLLRGEQDGEEDVDLKKVRNISYKIYLDFRQHSALKLPKLPKPLEGVISQEKFEKSRAYTLDKSFFHFVHEAVNILIETSILSFGVLPWLWNKSGDFLVSAGVNAENEIYHTLAFLACFSIWSQQTVWLFVRDMIKGLFLTALLGPPVISAIILIVQKGGPYFAIYLWAFIFVLSILMMTIYPILIAPLFNKFTPLPEGELRQKIENLASSLKFPLKKLFVIDGSTRSSHSNAYMYGFFNNKRIVLFDTLIQQCKEEEVVAVLTHELGHWKLNHTTYNFVVVQIITLLQFGGFTLVRNSKELFRSIYCRS